MATACVIYTVRSIAKQKNVAYIYIVLPSYLARVVRDDEPAKGIELN
jgi:hypothetical protein